MNSLSNPNLPGIRHSPQVLEREGRGREVLPLCANTDDLRKKARHSHWQLDIEEPNCEHCIDILTTPNP